MILSLQNVCFDYEHPVIQDLSLTLPEGGRTAVMGASGLGKTTLLHLMAGLLKPQSGLVDGIPPQGVSVVFQEPRLLPWLTVRQNLAVAAPNTAAARRDSLLADLGLASWQDAMPAALSGGMAQRVSLARALAFGSPLLLLDEPFAGLDADTKQNAAKVILQNHTGTMVAVVHDPGDAVLLGAVVVRPLG